CPLLVRFPAADRLLVRVHHSSALVSLYYLPAEHTARDSHAVCGDRQAHYSEYALQKATDGLL
ncbi:MAG: hypothetical protein M3Y56_13820, partial [Armatimonadota bacterium]|nr:hypothetical protein [Armatimonadota bacterium]